MMQSFNFKFKEVCNPSLKPLTNNMTKTLFWGHPQEMHITALFVKVLTSRFNTIKLNLFLRMTLKTAFKYVA